MPLRPVRKSILEELFMEKIRFRSEEIPEEVDFFVLEQTKVNGVTYILVTDSED